MYGAGVKGNVRRLLDAVWRGIPIPVANRPNARSMLGVGNLTEYMRLALVNPIASDRPLLLSDGDPVSTEGLLDAIGRALGKRPRVVKLSLGLMRALGALGDALAPIGGPIPTSAQIDRMTGSLVVDSSSAWAAAGIRPPMSFEAGIIAMCFWYRGLHAGGEIR
jgi:UDP-glucose 4-epimerase